MKASIVTVCFNSEATIKRTIESVNIQRHRDIEHIFVDGASGDGTVALIQRHSTRGKRVLSEPDKGIYDAMNKGAALATGDFVGFLNSDDAYRDEQVLSDVASAFESARIDFVFGDIEMFDRLGRPVLRWETSPDCASRLDGRQIPHPAFFVRATVLRRLSHPPFDASYKIAADLKQQLTLVNAMGCKGIHVPRCLVNMTLGGTSTRGFREHLQGWRECMRAHDETLGRGGLRFTIRKTLSLVSGTRFPILAQHLLRRTGSRH